jgi:GNAT superfamily N-acetyltransferase
LADRKWGQGVTASLDRRLLDQAATADLADARALLASQFAEHGIEQGDQGLEKLLERAELGRVFLARSGGEAIGLAVLAFTWTLEHGGLVAWLDELLVVPEARSAGVGNRLLHHALAAARDLGCAAVELEVDEGHARTSNLYAREGFTPLPRKRWVRRLDRDGA